MTAEKCKICVEHILNHKDVMRKRGHIIDNVVEQRPAVVNNRSGDLSCDKD